MNKCYIYAYFDPKTNDIFYVGKGTGYRYKTHLKPSVWKNPEKTCNPFLYHKIKSLMENNTPPIVKLIKENMSEEDAYNLESSIIKQHGRRFSPENGKLFNISEFKGGNKLGKKFEWSDTRRQRYRLFWKEKRKYDPSYEELYHDFITMNLNRTQISKKYDISVHLVKKRLQEYGIKKPKHLRYSPKNRYECLCCHKIFYTPHSVSERKYCSLFCYNRMKNVEKYR